LKSAAQPEAIRELTDEMDNVHAAWGYGIEHGEYGLIAPSTRGMGRYFESTGLLGDGIDHFESLVKASRAGSQDVLKMKALGLALAQQGMLYFRKGHFAMARKIYQESIDILRKIGEQALLTDSLVNLGIILHLDGEYDLAYQMMNEGLASAQTGNDRWFAAYARYNLGYIDSLLGRSLEGYEQMIAGLDEWREIGDPHSIALGLNHLVSTLIRLGRCEEARFYMQESIVLCEASKNRWGLGTAYRNDGLATMAQGDFVQAAVLFRKSLEIFNGFTTGWDIARSLAYLGDATLQADDLPKAKEIYLDALRTSLDANAIPITLDCLLGLAQLFVRTGDLFTGLELSKFVLNNPAGPRETKERAGRWLMQIDALIKIQNASFQDSWPETITLEELVNDLLTSSG
jgi:tetratricopeptide (TPR) repeat protein